MKNTFLWLCLGTFAAMSNSSNAFAQQTEWVAARIGLGYETSGNTAVLVNPITMPNGVSLEPIVNDYPEECFSAPGVTHLGIAENLELAKTDGSPDLTGEFLAIKMHAADDTEIYLSCSGESAVIRPFIEVTRDRASWHAIPASAAPDYILNYLFRRSGQALASGNDTTYRDNRFGGFDIQTDGTGSFSLGVDSRTFYAIVAFDNRADYDGFIATQTEAGHSAVGQSSTSSGPFEVLVYLDPVPNEKLFESFRQAYGEGLKLLLAATRTRNARMRRELRD